MKQVTQRLRDGEITVADVPDPVLRPEGVIVDVRASLLSAGTERAKVQTARQSLAGKARARPDQVRQVVEKARRDGVAATVDAVRMRLGQPSELGYSTAGVVVGVGARVRDLAIGDRVACGGGGYAVHAEMNYVPGNLCVTLPDEVDFAEATFATVGAIALHGVRQADVRLGERVAVIGLGLVGQLAGQLLRASGCTVIGVDLDGAAARRARDLGACDLGLARAELDGGPDAAQPCDAVLLTAATPSDDPIELAARLSRDRARVVVVGDVGLHVPRAGYYDKELELRLSRSYGPGRYDREYEERGLDYPVGYVRWTERRNMRAFVELIARKSLDVRALITDEIPVGDASVAYERLTEPGRSSPLGLVLRYEPSQSPDVKAARTTPRALSPAARPVAPSPVAGVIGAGSFAQRILMPGLIAAGFSLRSVASAQGLSARGAVEALGHGDARSVEEVLADPEIDLVAVATRHSTHAELALRALDAGRHVFVEKPPALTTDELDELAAAAERTNRRVRVGFNRRHAPLAQPLRAMLRRSPVPAEILIRVNAGPLAAGYWLNDPADGGGRLLGEGCHFVDLACWLVGRLPARVSCHMAPAEGVPVASSQSFVVSLGFDDGSLATIFYGSHGASRAGKERIEAHAGGVSVTLDDFRHLRTVDGRRSRVVRKRTADKGHRQQLVALREALTSVDGTRSDEPDPLSTMRVTLAALDSALTGRTCALRWA